MSSGTVYLISFCFRKTTSTRISVLARYASSNQADMFILLSLCLVHKRVTSRIHGVTRHTLSAKVKGAWPYEGTEWRNGMVKYTEYSKIQNIRNALKQGSYRIFHNKTRNVRNIWNILKTQNKGKIFWKGYTCIQSTPITRTLATDSNLMLTRSNTF